MRLGCVYQLISVVDLTYQNHTHYMA
jgi:hypothetical protein